MAPPPYIATPSTNNTGSLGWADPFSPRETPAPCFHPSTNDNHFGFQEPTHLVPPGTEPNLHALNNPYIAAQREKERQLTTSQVARPNATGSPAGLTHQAPYLSLGGWSSSSYLAPRNHSLPDVNQNIYPSLLGPAISKNNEDRNNGEGEGGDEEGYHSEYDGSTSGHSGISDEEHELHGQHAPRGQICFIVCNHSLTFIYRLCHRCAEYSSDEAHISSWRWFWVFSRRGRGNCACIIKELWMQGSLITMNTPASHTTSEYSDCQCFRAWEPGKHTLVQHFGILFLIFSVSRKHWRSPVSSTEEWASSCPQSSYAHCITQPIHSYSRKGWLWWRFSAWTLHTSPRSWPTSAPYSNRPLWAHMEGLSRRSKDRVQDCTCPFQSLAQVQDGCCFTHWQPHHHGHEVESMWCLFWTW